MPPALTNTFARLRKTIDGFTLAQRTIAIIGIAAVVLGGVALTSFLTKPTLTPLFSGLAAEDASAIVDQLSSANVSYELTDGGTTIMVPQDAVYPQRLAAAAAGLPAGDTDGYSLLDSMGVTSSEFQQTVTYKRAIEGELARTIGAVKGVKTASVKLAIPEESVFTSEKVNPTASVFVETARGQKLSPTQVESIVHLTSASVSGMTPADVAVIDQEGATLSAIGSGTSGNLNQQSSEYELRVAASVQKMLDKVVGVGNATVTVAAEVGNATRERLDESYSPAAEGTPPQSESTTSETQKGGQREAGVLGTEKTEDVAEDGEYEKVQTTKNNVVNKSVESTNTPAGAISRQTIAVAINQGEAAGVDLDQVEGLVASAAGIDTRRGDAVTVEMVTFSTAGAAEAEEALDAARKAEEEERAAETMQTVITVGGVAVVALGALVAFLILRRRRAAADEVAAQIAAVPPIVAAEVPDEDPEPVLTIPTTVAVTYTDAEGEEIEPLQVTLDRRRKDVGDFARRNPERTAEHLRTIIRNGKDA